MRFPQWARSNDSQLRLKYLCSVMAAYAHSDASLYRLSHLARVNYQTALKAQNAGRMSPRVAAALADAADGSGVKAVWLMAPEMIHFDENGEVVE